jgi:CRP-like cAMP-binding protein
MSTPHRPFNRLLAALPVDEYQKLLPDLETIELTQNQVLYKPGNTIYSAYFPINAAISLLKTRNDQSVEVGIIGREGIVGSSVVLGSGKARCRTIVQIPGNALKMNANILEQEFQRSKILNRLLLRYTDALMGLMSQGAFCNRFHSVEERLCWWLLASHDRTRFDTLPYTQDFLAYMLGSDRSDINKIAGPLQQAGLISYSRGQITIIDQAGLETRSCECYRIVKDEFDNFLGA